VKSRKSKYRRRNLIRNNGKKYKSLQMKINHGQLAHITDILSSMPIKRKLCPSKN